MTAKQIREKETEHLKHELEEQRKHLFHLRSQAVTEKLELMVAVRPTFHVPAILAKQAADTQPT